VTVASINASGLYTSTGDLLITQANQIGVAALPVGTVIQTRTSYSQTVVTSTSGAGLEVVGLDFTPIYSNSMIYIVATSGQIQRTGFSSSVNNWGNFFLSIDNGTPTTFSGNVSFSGSVGAIGYPQTFQDGRHYATINFTSPSWSGMKRIAALGSRGGDQGSISFCFQNLGATMTVMEIKQ
jgi:hypothetical protein